MQKLQTMTHETTTETNQTIKLKNKPQPEAYLGDGYKRQRHTDKAACRQPKRSPRAHQVFQAPRLPWNRRLRTRQRAGLPPDMDCIGS